MKQFIELTNAQGRRLVNVDSICFVQEGSSGCLIIFGVTDSNNKPSTLIVTESYDTIIRLIQSAQ
jgi:hypothetical protein